MEGSYCHSWWKLVFTLVIVEVCQHCVLVRTYYQPFDHCFLLVCALALCKDFEIHLHGRLCSLYSNRLHYSQFWKSWVAVVASCAGLGDQRHRPWLASFATFYFYLCLLPFRQSGSCRWNWWWIHLPDSYVETSSLGLIWIHFIACCSPLGYRCFNYSNLATRKNFAQENFT